MITIDFERGEPRKQSFEALSIANKVMLVVIVVATLFFIILGLFIFPGLIPKVASTTVFIIIGVFSYFFGSYKPAKLYGLSRFDYRYQVMLRKRRPLVFLSQERKEREDKEKVNYTDIAKLNWIVEEYYKAKDELENDIEF